MTNEKVRVVECIYRVFRFLAFLQFIEILIFLRVLMCNSFNDKNYLLNMLFVGKSEVFFLNLDVFVGSIHLLVTLEIVCG